MRASMMRNHDVGVRGGAALAMTLERVHLLTCRLLFSSNRLSCLTLVNSRIARVSAWSLSANTALLGDFACSSSPRRCSPPPRSASLPTQANGNAASPRQRRRSEAARATPLKIARKADSSLLAAIAKYKPQDATTNPSLILAASKKAEYAKLMDVAVEYGKAQGGDINSQVEHALDRLLVEFGKEILKIVPGKVSTEVDARYSFDTKESVNKALHIIDVSGPQSPYV